jgi:hypothetical protein
MSNLLNCYGAEQSTQYLLSIRYGVTCNRDAFKSEAKQAVNLMLLSDLSDCGAYNENISCFLKGKSVTPCDGISFKDCQDIEVVFVPPTPKPCYLTANLFD